MNIFLHYEPRLTNIVIATKSKMSQKWIKNVSKSDMSFIYV